MHLRTLTHAISSLPDDATSEMVFPVFEECAQSDGIHTFLWAIWQTTEGTWAVGEFYPYDPHYNDRWVINTTCNSLQEAMSFIGGWMEDFSPEPFLKYFKSNQPYRLR